MRIAHVGVALGLATLIVGAGLTAIGSARAEALSPDEMSRLLGGAPTCLSNLGIPADCTGCGVATACSPFTEDGEFYCIKVVANPTSKCGNPHTVLNLEYTCTAETMPEACGTKSYTDGDTATKKCRKTACTGTPDACGINKAKTTITPCEQGSLISTVSGTTTTTTKDTTKKR